MSENPNYKKTKKSRKLHRDGKAKTQIRKPQVTKEYQKVENEVQELLERMSFDGIDGQDEGKTSTESLNIFCSPKNQSSTNENEIENQESILENSASSFIQISEENADSISNRVKCQFEFDSNLTYIPPAIKSDSFNNSREYSITDSSLYRTFCSHKFRPIFCGASPEVIEIPSRQLLKFHLRNLRFTEHPLLNEEHRLSNTLEDMYSAYSERKLEKLYELLQSERKKVKRLINSQCKNVDTLEESLNKIQTMRNQLYSEELQNKKLLQQILEYWVKLKNHRKSQKFRCTKFRLKIRMEEINDFENDKREWLKRLECDLNEIYREELEKYYHQKRLMKSCATDDDERYLSPKPKPRKPDIDKITSQLKNRLTECTRLPGEPIIDIIRSDFMETYESVNLKGSQKLKTYFLKIFLDEQFVGATRNYRLEPDLSLSIDETIGILLERRMPKEIKISLYEKKQILGAPIADIITNLPHKQSNELKQVEVLYFTSDKQPISGRLFVCFQKDAVSHPAEAALTLASQKINSNSNSNEDENEGNVSLTSIHSDSCTFEEDLLLFPDKLQNNRRFTLLCSRYMCVDPRTQHLRCIPAFEKEINMEIFEENEQNEENRVLDTGNWMDPIDLYKHNGKKYIRNLFEAIRNHCKRLERIYEKSTDLLVGGNEPITLKLFSEALLSIFTPKISLNPTGWKFTNNQLEHFPARKSFDDFKIIINVVRATGIPIRSSIPIDTDENESNSHSFRPDYFQYSDVRPYVSIFYKEKSVRTLSAEGSSPTWNEQLVLQMSGNPLEYHDDIKIILFDEFIEYYTDVEDDNLENHRIQSNWLGEYRIPISSLISRNRIEGVFELNSSRILLGYRPPNLDYREGGISIVADQFPEIKEAIYIWLYVCIEPSYPMPNLITNNLECSELNEVRLHLNGWSLQVKELHNDRFIDPLVCTADAKRVCLTRLLEPIPLPFDTSNSLVDSVCRFVSMLNILRNYDNCTGFSGVWLSNQTLLDTTWASQKDLGVLLANYFLTIGIPCSIALGIANPYGESAYVLYQQNEFDYTLVEPTTGKKYSSKDIFCPLTKINYIFNKDNIYCNIQSESRVSMMNLDVNDNSCWLNVFNRKNPSPLGGVQNLNYNYRNSFNCSELRKNIERKIVKKINSWRSMRKTTWNRALQSKMEDILVGMEHSSTFSDNLSGNLLSKEYNEQFLSFSNYKIYGFTLNFSYTNLSSISERIRSTGIHLNSNKNVEFCVAVHLHSYPNNVISVWIFLISLIPHLH